MPRPATIPTSTRARRGASLDEVLAYRNPRVVERFRKEYPVTKRAADEIWLETLRWLWLCGSTTRRRPLEMMPSMSVIDEMWHAFVLFTKDYTSFCKAHFGRYIHHLPTTHDDVVAFENPRSRRTPTKWRRPWAFAAARSTSSSPSTSARPRCAGGTSTTPPSIPPRPSGIFAGRGSKPTLSTPSYIGDAP